jgi:hypothetical protein
MLATGPLASAGLCFYLFSMVLKCILPEKAEKTPTIFKKRQI